MYANIGRKIKGLAIGAFIVEALGAVIVGIILLSNDAIEVGLPILLAGPVVAWVSSWFMYSFGELIDKTCDIARNTYGRVRTSEAQNEQARLDAIYARAQNTMSAANTESEYKEAARLFETISEYKDAAIIAQTCYEKAEIARKDAILAEGKAYMAVPIQTIVDFEAAIEEFQKIPGWKDADDLVVVCEKKIEELEVAKKDAILAEGKAYMAEPVETIANYEAAIRAFQKISGWKDADEQISACEKKIEELQKIARQKAEKRAKLIKKISIITASAIATCLVLVALWTQVLSPMIQYNKAQTLLDSGSYDEAITIFTELADYKDAADKVLETKYAKAESLSASKDYDASIAIFTELTGYKDAADKVLETKYAKAESLFVSKDYDASIAIFTELADYKDAADKVLETKYAKAESLFVSKDYDASIEIFTELTGYKDAAERVKEAHYTKAGALAESGDYAQAADIYKMLGEYEDSATLYPATVLNYANALLENKELASVREQALILEKYDDTYAEHTNALYVRLMDAYYAAGWYEDALTIYKKTKDYSEDSDKYKDMTYKYAQSLLDQKKFVKAKTTFKCVSGYLDADQKVLECDYQSGLYELSQKNYFNAISAFERVEDYKDSKAKIKEAKYLYVKADMSRKNSTTYEYLKELKTANYKDSADIFKKLYSWKVDVLAINSDPNDIRTNKTSISMYDPLYFHIKLTGGEPGAKTVLKVKYYLPNGNTGWNTFKGDWYDGYTGWFGWTDGINDRYTLGAMSAKAEFYDGSGNKIGEGSVKIFR